MVAQAKQKNINTGDITGMSRDGEGFEPSISLEILQFSRTVAITRLSHPSIKSNYLSFYIIHETNINHQPCARVINNNLFFSIAFL